MSDLYLTDQEKQFFADSEAPKEIKSFSQWSGENNASNSDPQSFLDYADFMRNELGDSYNAQSEMEIQYGLRQGLSTIGGMDEETMEQALAPKDVDFDTKFNVVFSSLDAMDPDRQALLDFKSGEQVLAEDANPAEEYKLKVDSMREQAESIVNRRLEGAREQLVGSNQLPFAFVSDEEGNRKLLISDAASEMPLAQAIKSSQLGGVSFNPQDVALIESNLQVIPDTGLSVYKTKELMEISKGIVELSQDDNYVSAFVDGHGKQMARGRDTTAESYARAFGNNVADLISAFGVSDDEIDEHRKRVGYASRRGIGEAVEYITDRLNESGANYKSKDVRDAYETLVVQNGLGKGYFSMRTEGNQLTENIIMTKLGAQINPAVYANDEVFENSIKAHPELSENTKKLLIENRDVVLQDKFEDYSNVLHDSKYAEEWSEALLLGRQAGKKDVDIFKEFTSNEDVFSELGARASGIAASVGDSLLSLMFLVPAAFGNETGKAGLQMIAQEQADRRQVAQMFGAEFGVGQDIMEAIAPMIVDIVATRGLATAASRLGGAAFLTATKGGSKLTAAGMIKGITTNVLRAGDETFEAVAKTAVARGLIKESTEAGGRAATIKALKAYNHTVAQKLGVSVGTFVPAASRSAAMSYGNMYNQLKATHPEMSDDEIHDRAMGFAMVTGAATGIITSAFSMIGRGGVESALLNGMSFKEAKYLLGALGNTGGFTDDALKTAMGKVLRESLSKHSYQFLRTGKKIAKNAIDEAMEEGMDQLVNSFVEDVALDQNTPLAERWNQTVHAAIVGGALGAGVPAIQAGASRVGITPMDKATQAIRLQNQFYEDVASKLSSTGSPLTADQVRERIGRQKRALSEAAVEPQQEQEAPALGLPAPEPVLGLPAPDEKTQAQNAIDNANQELTALREELDQLDSLEEATEEQINRLGEVNTLIAEKENQIATLSDTVRSIEAQGDPLYTQEPVKEVDLLKKLEGKSKEEIAYYVERAKLKKNVAGIVKEIPPNKSYARRVGKGDIQFDAVPTSSENSAIIQKKAIDLAGMGYPQDVTYDEDYDLPIYNDADAASFSDYVASAVYTLYPTVKVKEPYGGSVFQSSINRQRYNPVTGKKETVSGFLNENGSGVFDNDPMVVAEMLRANVPVSIPNNFSMANLNPSIIIDADRNVVDVVSLVSGTKVLESKITEFGKNRELYYNNVEARRLAAIPFKAVNLPDGVARFDPTNGATQQGSFDTVAQIKNSLNTFLSELQKTGDERNIEAHSRMEPLSNSEDAEAQLQAFINAREKFVFNARMFELRNALQQDPTDKVGKFLERINLQKEAAAKMVLPLISIDKAGSLNNDSIIETFVDQYALNNPDLSGNTPPSFASVLADSTSDFEVQQEFIEDRYAADAAQTYPIDRDMTNVPRKQVDFTSNFGRKPDGAVATPQDVAAMMVASIDKAVEAINSDQKLRLTVEEFVSDNVFDGTPQMQEIVRSLSPQDLFGFLSSWMVTNNGRIRQSVSDFVTDLESGSMFRGIDLRDALIATRFTTRPDGLGLENKTAVDEFQSLFAEYTGELLSVDQARNTMLAIDGVLRTRLSRASETAELRGDIEAFNNATIAKLGLKSGDPESVVKALKNISKGMGNKNEQLVAKLLLEDTNFIRNNVRFVIGEGSIDIAGKYIKSVNGNHIVFINRSSGNGRGLINTLLEEYIHAVTSDTVAATTETLPKNKASARNQLEKIFNGISRNYDAEVTSGAVPNSVVENGLTNLDEFIAKFFLVDGFQKYVKDIVGPNSFDGIVDAIVTIFPKVTSSEKRSFVSAFKDVLDLGKRGRKHTAPDAKSIGSSVADGILFSAPTESEVEVDNSRMMDSDLMDGLTADERAALEPLMSYIRGVVPFGIQIKRATIDTRGSLAYVSKDQSAIYLNTKLLAREVDQLGDISIYARGLIGVTLNEELAHTAGYNSLTQEEVDAYVASLSDGQFNEIISEYAQNSPESFAQELRNRLASEDAEVVLATKRQLAEEKLRMHLQKVTRGFTTEEDVRFWKSKPSLLAILKRYLSAAIRRFAANREKLHGAGGAALNKMINEMRAIEAGFVRQPTTLPLDPENVDKTYAMIARGTQGIDDYLSAAPAGAVDHVYERESARFNKLREEGRIVVGQDLDQFAGQSILLHQPDTAFAGEVTLDGETIVTGQGGVYYPVLFSDQNYFWASTKTAAEGLAASLNEISRQNGGKILMGLTSADVNKLFSSTSMANGAVNFFLNLTKNPRFYGLNKATFNKILVEASKVKTRKGKVFSKKLKVSDGLEKNIKEMRILLDSEQSTFDVREEFVKALSSGIASVYETPKQEVLKDITDPEELKRIDDIKEKSFRVASLLLGNNEYANSAIKKGKLSKAAIIQGLGDMFTEPFVKTFQQLDKKTGNIYAVLEIDGEVEAIRAEEHDSYKYTVVSKTGEKPKVNVLGNSYYWADVTVDVDTNQPIPESKHLSYYPTFGVSNTKLKLTKADEKAKEKSLPLLFSAPVADTGDYAPIVNLLEIPVSEIARNGQPKNSLLRFIDKALSGEISEPFKRIIENRTFFKKAVEDDVAKFKKEMDGIILKTYGSFENAPMDLIAKAQGYAFRTVVSEETQEQVDDAYQADIDDINQRLANEEIDRDTAIAERKIASDKKEKSLETAYEEGIKQAEEERNQALRKLSFDSPELVSFIVDIRQRYIIPMQTKLRKSGLEDDINLKIQSTGEVYLTRAYRMFTDSTYYDMVKNDEKYAKVREAAMIFFRKQFIRGQAEVMRDEAVAEGQEMTYQEAKRRAARILEKRNENSNTTYEQEALDEFLMMYEPSNRRSRGSSESGHKMLMDNLRKRKDLPKAIRDLLGEYDEQTGTDLILRTYSTVASIAAQKTFLERLRVAGKQFGLMVDAETMIATEENREKYKGWIPVRPNKMVSKNDPLSNMYIHPEFQKSLDMTLQSSFVKENASTAENVLNTSFSFASKLSGKAMAAKTLYSVGHHLRNAIGNIIFGTAQGYLRYDQMLLGMSKAAVQSMFTTGGKVDPVITELIGLGVVGDEIRAGIMRDLLNGKQTPEGVRKEIDNLMDKSKLSLGAKALAAVEKKAQDLSAALDAAYKIGYFNFELSHIERAAEQGGPDSLYGEMSPTQRKREAARKVLMTSQSYSQAPPLVSEFTKSPAGLMFSPFLRFKAEMFRIPFNTYKLGLEEIRSKDPVMVRRGYSRISWMTFVIGGLSSALPMAMAFVSGIGDDEFEDEAMRAGIPEYLRGHTFYYFFKDGILKSFDATYLNPFAGTIDPILRAIEKIREGKYAEAGSAFAMGYLKDTFFDTQILAGSVIRAGQNLDPSTGKPIWNKGVDDPVDVAFKIFQYIGKEAYAPKIGVDFYNGLQTQTVDGFKAEMMKQFIPARIHDVDLQNQYEKYLLGHNKRFANVKSGLNQLYKNKPMSDETVREIIDENLEARRRMNHELMRITRGYNSLGIDSNQIMRTMADMNVGKKRMQLLSYGYMEKPSMRYIAETLLKENNQEFGPTRLKTILDYYQTRNRYLPVIPVTETD